MDTEPETAHVGSETTWLSTEQQADWRSLVRMLMMLPSALDGHLKREAGLNSFEYHVLAALSEAPDRALVLTDLAGLAQGSLSRLSHAISRLERAGWVERRSGSTERGAERSSRCTEAWLTDAGMAKLEDVAPGHVREVRRLVVDVLGPAQLQALAEAARAVTAAIAAVTTECAESTGCADETSCAEQRQTACCDTSRLGYGGPDTAEQSRSRRRIARPRDHGSQRDVPVRAS